MKSKEWLLSKLTLKDNEVHLKILAWEFLSTMFKTYLASVRTKKVSRTFDNMAVMFACPMKVECILKYLISDKVPNNTNPCASNIGVYALHSSAK